MMRRANLLFVIAGIASAFTGNTALAESVVIEADKTQLVTIAAKPATVVVGNPSIADVSLNGNQVFLHGHGFGNTNIMILDGEGKQLANLDVVVTQAAASAVTLYRGTSKFSLVCGPVCESEIQVGDVHDWFKPLLEQRAGKNALATGSETNEAKAPTAAQ